MSKTEIYPTQPDLTAVQHWPDTAPAVAMDIRLGQTREQFDVDPNMLTDALSELGAVPEQIPSLTVNFTGDSGLGVGGSYEPNTKTIDIPAKKKVVEAFLHEGKHFADHAIGALPEEGSLEVMKRGAIKGVLGSFAITAALYLHRSNPALIPDLLQGTLHAAAGAYLGAYASYRLQPHERRAYAAEDDKSLHGKYANLLSITPRENE